MNKTAFPYNILGAQIGNNFRQAPWAKPLVEGDQVVSEDQVSIANQCPTCKCNFDTLPAFTTYEVHRTVKGRSSGKLVWKHLMTNPIKDYSERLTIIYSVSRDYILTHALPCIIDLPKWNKHHKDFEWDMLTSKKITPAQVYIYDLKQWGKVPGRENAAIQALEAIS